MRRFRYRLPSVNCERTTRQPRSKFQQVKEAKTQADKELEQRKIDLLDAPMTDILSNIGDPVDDGQVINLGDRLAKGGPEVQAEDRKVSRRYAFNEAQPLRARLAVLRVLYDDAQYKKPPLPQEMLDYRGETIRL
jgi:hypothetical protein